MTDVKQTCALLCDTQFCSPAGTEKNERVAALRRLVLHEITRAVQMGHTRFLCGFTGPTDFLVAETVLEIRDRKHSIHLESVLAYEDEAANWDESTREVYFDLLGQCDAEHLMHTRFTDHCMVERNHFLIDHSDMLISISDGLLGNATEAIGYAARQAKTIVCISPSRLATRKFG